VLQDYEFLTFIFFRFLGLGNKKTTEKIASKFFRNLRVCSYFGRNLQGLFIVTESKNIFFLYTK